MLIRYSKYIFYLIIVSWLSNCQKDNQPPFAKLEVYPSFSNPNTPFIADASKSSDLNQVDETLLFRWDFNNDGIWETDFKKGSKTTITYDSIGIKVIKVEVLDYLGVTARATDTVYIFGHFDKSTYTDPRDGEIYQIIKIMDKWWFSENLRVGTALPSDSITKNNQIIEKYLNESPFLPITNDGLYTWEEAMDYSVENDQEGICPPGWHIPSLNEWNSLAVDFPTIAINYYYREPLNLEFDGNYILTGWAGGQVFYNLFGGFGQYCTFWTSTSSTDSEGLYNRVYIIVSNDQLENQFHSQGFLTRGDFQFYDNFGNIITTRTANYVRCVKDLI